MIIDDHAVVRNGIAQALANNGSWEISHAASKAEGVAFIAHTNPDVIIVDINLPDGSGLEIVRWARSLSKELAIIVLTFEENDALLLDAARAGASAFLSKSEPLGNILAAVTHAIASPQTFSAQKSAQALVRSHDRFNLTGREIEILSSLHLPLSLAELAQSLHISESTLKTHLSSIYRKLSVHNRVGAIEVARRAAII